MKKVTWKVGDHGISKSGTWTVLQVNSNGDELWVSFKGGSQERVFSHQARKLTLVEKAKRNAMGIIALIVIIAAIATGIVFTAKADKALEVPATETPMMIPVTGETQQPVSTEAPVVVEAPATEAPVETKCIIPEDNISDYMEVSSREAFSFNQVPANFNGHRYVIAITHIDGSHSITYGEAGTTWSADETVSTAMVNLIIDGGYETVCIANGFAEAVKPSLGEIPVVMIP